MERSMHKPWHWALLTAVAVASSGCAVTQVGEQSTTSLVYDQGRPVTIARAERPVAQVVVPTPAPAAPEPGIVYFDFDRSNIKPQYRPVVEDHAGWLRANSKATAVIEGHTDQYGSVEYNLALGQRRAEAVRRSLVLLGVPEQRLEAVSYGELKPAQPGLDAQSRALNRRAEIRTTR